MAIIKQHTRVDYNTVVADVNASISKPNASVSNMPTVKLASGHEMPVIAYGTFRSSPNEVYGCILEALKAGYRHFDLAHLYMNEKEIGQAFKHAFETGIVKRSDLFITGKLWNSDHEIEIVPQACQQSLHDLGLDYFDLYLIHFPVAWKFTGLEDGSWGASELGDTPLIDTWRAMEKLVDQGVCKSIGVSNYPLMLLHDLVCQARVPVSCNQIETHVYYTRDSLVRYCQSRGIVVTAHTPLGGGKANEIDFTNEPSPLEDAMVKAIASTKGVTPAQVLLRFLLQRGIVVLPKSVRAFRIAENIDLFGFQLTGDEMLELAALDRYRSYKTNLNPLVATLGGPDAFTKEGTDIFD